MPLFALSLCATACSSDDAGQERSDPAPESPPAGTLATAQPVKSLGEVCPDIEAQRPETDFGFPSTDAQRTAFTTYGSSLHTMASTLGTDDSAAVVVFAVAVEAVADPALPPIDASEQIDNATSEIRNACQAAGSPIFQ